MNKNNISNPYSEHYGEDRNSWPPEVFLAVLLHELRNPIAVMKGWAAILSNEDAKEHHSTAAQVISEKIAIVENLHQGLADYISVHPPQLDT